jgi:GDPmannose 4,6-dehydratase
MKTALIFGITGQDGSYLARLLLKKGYRVVGASRDAHMASLENLRSLGILDQVSIQSVSLTDFRSVLQCISNLRPDEIYNLAGQTSVGLSFDQPVETFESITIATSNLLEAVRFIGAPIRLYNSCSGECFGEAAKPSIEDSAFRPRSPYAVAKAAAYWQVANYREAYGIYASSGILFNHESPLRPERFVTQKIIRAACRIAAGSKEKLELGNLSVRRDWGWAPDFVDGMYRILQAEKPMDFILATGKSHSLEEFLDTAFRAVDLKWRDHVHSRKELLRPLDLKESIGNPARASEILDWRPSVDFSEIVARMVSAGQNGNREL